MKTNLHKKYKTNKHMEQNGVWLHVDSSVSFLVARWKDDSQQVRAAVLKNLQPVAQKLKHMEPEEALKISVKTFVEGCVRDWKGVTDEQGNEIPFSQEACIELLIELPDVYKLIEAESVKMENYRDELGNS